MLAVPSGGSNGSVPLTCTDHLTTAQERGSDLERKRDKAERHRGGSQGPRVSENLRRPALQFRAWSFILDLTGWFG